MVGKIWATVKANKPLTAEMIRHIEDLDESGETVVVYLAYMMKGKVMMGIGNRFFTKGQKMIGRYISEESYHRLGLEQNEEFNKCASKTLLVILEEDVANYIFTLEQRMAFAESVCGYYSDTLDGVVEHAREYGTMLLNEE